MNTIQLERVMRTDTYGKVQFRGVFAADQLPMKILKYPSAFIVNTDPASKPGTHWVAFYFTSQKEGEFMTLMDTDLITITRSLITSYIIIVLHGHTIAQHYKV